MAVDDGNVLHRHSRRRQWLYFVEPRALISVYLTTMLSVAFFLECSLLRLDRNLGGILQVSRDQINKSYYFR